MWVVEYTQDFDLIFEDVGVFDESLVDHLHASFRIGWLLESGLINGAVSASSDGLYRDVTYLVVELVDGLDVFLP